jgi:hypothetical protein
MMTALSAKFGLAWNTYLQAVVYNYNVSTCVSTGYSPYELMFGRVGSYLQDLPFTRERSQRTANNIDWGRDLVSLSANTYKIVRETQAKAARLNQTRNNQKQRAITFTPEDKEQGITGDLVLFYEPQQTKLLTDSSVLDASKAPRKWTPVWTGPHTIVQREGDNHYRLFHRGKSARIKTHVNRLIRFYPWSDDVISTSDWEDIHAYRSGEWANEGALIIVPFLPPHPFGVAVLTKAFKDGNIEYQWWGNAADNIRQPQEPGWTSSRSGRVEDVYYQQEARDPGDEPYAGHLQVPMTQTNIVVHSFELTKNGKLPMVVLKAVDEDYRVWWTMKIDELPMRANTISVAAQQPKATNSTRHEITLGNPGRRGNQIKAKAANSTRHERADDVGIRRDVIANPGVENSTQHECEGGSEILPASGKHMHLSIYTPVDPPSKGDRTSVEREFDEKATSRRKRTKTKPAKLR